MCVLQSNSQNIFPPPLEKLKVSAFPISGELSIDGQLDEHFWEMAEVLSNFIQIEPHQGEPSQFRTVVKVLYNDKYLYIGAICYGKNGEKRIRVSDLNRDFSFRQNDTFAVGIDGFNDQRNTITLAVNPYETQKDYLSFDDFLFDSDWNGLWKVRTSIGEDYWIAEFAIPWKSLRYDTSSNLDEYQKWGINFVRQRRASNEISAWSPYPRSFGFNRAEYFGQLQGIKPPKSASNIQFNPYTLISQVNTKRIGEQNVKETEYKLGGEIKWALNSHLILDATFNTDFAQAEADLQVNNISRFSVFFPERRQFFLENASLFGVGLDGSTGFSGNMSIIPFFSRQVGLTKNGIAINLDGGLRLVHRDIKKSFGFMTVRQAGDENQLSNFISVGRYSQNVGKSHRLGAVITSKVDKENTNLVGGVDAFFRINKEQYLNFMFLQSYNTSDKSRGYSGYLQYLLTNNFLSAWFTQSFVGEQFDPQVGFLSRTNVLGSSSGVIGNLRGKYIPFPLVIRSFQPRLVADIYHQASSGRQIERSVTLSPFWLEFQNGGFVSFQTNFQYQNLQNPFSPLGINIPVGEYNFIRYDFRVGSDPSSKISIKANFDFGHYFDGTLSHLNTTLSLTPIPHISLIGSVDHNNFKNIGQDNYSGSVTLYTMQGRFFWEYQPLSYAYLIYNSKQLESIAPNQIYEQEQAIFKLSFLKQF